MTDPRRWIDLASQRLGGRAVVANDEFFAPKENLLKPGRGVFIEGKYTDRGKWMDGWETRRRRDPGHDWCIIRLGAPGVLRRVTVDTNHFRGNHPQACSIDACELEGNPGAHELAELDDAWIEVLPQSPLQGHSENDFPLEAERRFTHLRLNIFPDGGVARLRVLGEARPDWPTLLSTGEAVDLAAATHGGAALACSDMFFSDPANLLVPGRSDHMGDGWETKRRRRPGHDWVVIRLGRRGMIERIEVDTNHFKGNYPESCSMEICDWPGDANTLADRPESAAWTQILARTELRADARHFFEKELTATGPATHVRFNIYPDGGVSRLRIHGRPRER